MCEDRHHEREANERKQEADHQGRRDAQSPKRHRERVHQHRSDGCVNSHCYAEAKDETTLILSATKAKTNCPK